MISDQLVSIGTQLRSIQEHPRDEAYTSLLKSQDAKLDAIMDRLSALGITALPHQQEVWGQPSHHSDDDGENDEEVDLEEAARHEDLAA